MDAWPAEHEWPAPDATSLEWARFYLHTLKVADIRPTPAQADRDAHARHLAEEAHAEWCHDHRSVEIPLKVYVQMQADAQVLADSVRGPIPRIAALMQGSRATDALLVKWFEPLQRKAADTQHHRDRGVCVLLGQRGPFDTQIDVDPRRGGDLNGALAQTPGLRVATPRGGVHVFLRSDSGRAVHRSDGALAPGLEVRTSGWALVPCGRATPGRTFVSRARPVAPPPALLTAPPRVPRPSAAVAVTTDRTGAPLGRCAAIIASEIGRGDGRTAAAGTIVGMLARAEGLPEDVVDALAALLVEHGAAMDWPAARVREELTRWRELLTRGPRDAEFAAEVLQTWQAVRDIGPVRKGAAWARAQARSLWKTADRRQEGTAGAEDLGHLGGVSDYVAPMVWPAAAAPAQPSAATPALDSTVASVAEVRASDYVLHGPVCLCEQCRGTDAVVVDAKQAEYERMLRRLLPSIAQAYPRESLQRDFAKVPARVEVLYPFADFVTGRLEEGEMGAPPVGHGYGQWFGRAYGGITEGDFQAFGAAGAKGGKTFFIGQMADGLAMGTAARVLGVPGYEAAPLVMPVWVSEMPKEGEIWLRMMSRHFGFDLAALSKGAMSVEMPGVRHMAQMLDMSPARVVAQARAIADYYDDPAFADIGHALAVQSKGVDAVPAWAAHHVVREIDLSVLPNPQGQGRARVDHRTGPTMIGYVADAVALQRRDLACVAGVAEDAVLPLLILDPGQRFAGEGSSSKDALDALLGAVVTRICRRRSGLGAACIMSSDTTKAAARDLDLDIFRSASGQRLAADIFSGSQGIMHHCDVYAICGQDTGVPYRQTQWVRVLQSRTGAPAECFPFSWETHLGRFRPRPAESLLEAQTGGRPKCGNRAWSPPGQVADHDAVGGPRLSPYKQNGGRRHYGRPDD